MVEITYKDKKHTFLIINKIYNKNLTKRFPSEKIKRYLGRYKGAKKTNTADQVAKMREGSAREAQLVSTKPIHLNML